MESRAKYKMCRRLGAGVYEKCQTQQYTQSEMKKSKNAGKRPKQLSDYGRQLIEKQKVRFSYGISERQLGNYVDKATVIKGMPVVDKLFELLETRLDNVIYRLGFAPTRRMARQLASHGHFTVNGTKVTVPSIAVRVGDIISVREGSKSSPVFADLKKKLETHTTPTWLKFSVESMQAEVVGKPKNDEQFLQLGTVLEFYSR